MRAGALPGRPNVHSLVIGLAMSTVDPFYERVAAELRARSDGTKQYWVGIAGGPGSGKSTLARGVAHALGKDAVVLPMDGFHLYRAQLEELNDPEHAIARRGAPFTFDGGKFCEKMRELHSAGAGTWPSFDHAVGDPIENDIRVDQSHRIVLVEGNYLLLDEKPWSDVRSFFDETWFVSIPEAIARDRVARRNAEAWDWSLERAYERVDSNDVLNMRTVAATEQFASRSFDATTVPFPHLSAAASLLTDDGTAGR